MSHSCRPRSLPRLPRGERPASVQMRERPNAQKFDRSSFPPDYASPDFFRLVQGGLNFFAIIDCPPAGAHGLTRFAEPRMIAALRTRALAKRRTKASHFLLQAAPWAKFS